MIKTEKKTEAVIAFKKYLFNKDYSTTVISMYGRYVKMFLLHKNIPLDMKKNVDYLKEGIISYLGKPGIREKKAIKAALHTFYRSITGYCFYKQLKSRGGTDSIDTEIERFGKYLTKVRRLGDNTIHDSCNTVRIFLYSVFSGKEQYTYKAVKFHHVQQYLSKVINHVCPASKKTMITRIRSFFKFLEFEYGIRKPEILDLPLITPVKKLSGIPRYLSDNEIDILLNAFSKKTLVGIRDYAIARCFIDLGLRCAEVASLTLDDINWINGSVIIKGTKSHSERTLPFPMATGEAIESYVKYSRPSTRERVIFVRFKREKGQAMGVSQIREAVRRAAIRANLNSFNGTHMLRHKVARDMIIHGVDIKTIADILGHESIETTLIYTKLNIPELRHVSGKWPEANHE